MKILINTNDVEIIANITDPSIAALSFDDQFYFFMNIFQHLIESSITKPVHNTSASNVIRLSENPKIFKKIND